MSPKCKFAEGEKVLCFHGPLIYEAKALKSTVTKDKQIKYYIHYAGWNKNWDEWVPENRVLKYNEANLQRQKDMFVMHNQPGKAAKKTGSKGKKGETPKDGAISSGGSESRASTPSKELTSTPLAAPATSRSQRSKQTATPGATAAKDGGETPTNKKDDEKEEEVKDEIKKDESLKRKRAASTSTTNEKPAGSTYTSNAATVVAQSAPSGSSGSSSVRVEPEVETDEGFLTKLEVKIKIPDELKQYLADDWDAITRQHKLIDIPAKVTVQDIVDQYTAFRKETKLGNNTKESEVTDVLNGIIEYFNVMLGSQLLYKFERPQYAEVLQKHPQTPLSKLYSGFHLLRLFVKLGPMLCYSALDEKSMQLLLGQVHEFLKFLVKNNVNYFNMSNFVNVTPEYHRITQ